MQVSSHEDVRTDRDDRVLTLATWCKLNTFSLDTGKRLIKSGQGPRVLQLSSRRIGITVAANREWQQARERV
jgi:hypothetical protein